jgi:hypothetical protein
MPKFLAFSFLLLASLNGQLTLASSRNDPSAKTRVYLFKPNAFMPNLETGVKVNASLDGVGLSYRRGAALGFYDFEIFHTGHGFIFDREEKIKGASQTGNFTLARAIASGGKQVRAYLLGGGGVSYNVATIGLFSKAVQPILTTKIGLDWNWGFIDFGYNIPVPTLGYKYNILTQTETGYDVALIEYQYSFIPVTRIGLGFSF